MPVLPLPTAMLICPPAPPVAVPVPRDRAPLVPDADVPELIVNAPLAPLVPLVPDAMLSTPLLPDVDVPVARVTAPLTAPTPESSERAPPVLLVPKPAATLTEPPVTD